MPTISLGPGRAVGILLALGACATGDAAVGGTTVVDSAGVAIATAPATDRALAWTLTELFRLGGSDEGPGSFTAANPAMVGTDAAGNIHVLDRQEFRVEVFSPTGQHLRFLGREGGGPGEMEFPIQLFVSAAGIVHVLDVSKQALLRWDATGAVLASVSLQGASALSPRIFGDTTVMGVLDATETARTTRLLWVVGADTTELTSESAPTGAMVQFSCVSFFQPPVFTPVLQWTSNGRDIATTRQLPYQVDSYHGGRLTRSIRRPLPTKASSVDDISRLYPEGMKIQFGGGGGCTIPASEIMEKQGVAPALPQIRSLALDPQGRLWVERYTFDDEPARVDVFDAESRYIGTLTGKSLPLGFVGTDVVLFPEEDAATGITRVVAYRIAAGN